MLDGAGPYNASVLVYHKDERISTLSYLATGQERLKKFDQTCMFEVSNTD